MRMEMKYGYYKLKILFIFSFVLMVKYQKTNKNIISFNILSITN